MPGCRFWIRVRVRVRVRLWHRLNCGSDLIPGLGTPYALGWPKQIQNKTKQKKQKKKSAYVSAALSCPWVSLSSWDPGKYIIKCVFLPSLCRMLT